MDVFVAILHTLLVVAQPIIIVSLVGVILLQRSEGGALGIGGGPGGLMSGRGAGDMLAHATAVLAVLFFITTIGLTIVSLSSVEEGSVTNRIDTDALIDAVGGQDEADEPAASEEPPVEVPAVPLDE